MWLDRFSGNSTPSGSPPRTRSYSPGPQRPSHLAPSSQPFRPSFSPRSSSLSLASNTSTSSLPGTARQGIGSALRQSIVSSPPVDVARPLDVLEKIVGASPRSRRRSPGSGQHDSDRLPTAFGVEEVDFKGTSLQAFAQSTDGEAKENDNRADQPDAQFVEDYEKEKDKFEDLHRSIIGCDEVLQSVETYLTSFQTDLGVVSAEIETLQSRSTQLNARLANRKNVETLLGPAVEEFSISPMAIRSISEGPIDENWTSALAQIDKRHKAIEARSEGRSKVKAVEDIKPLLDDLIKKAMERIRDFFVGHIKSLRSPNINAQIIQRSSFLRFKDLYAFLARHHPKLAEEIGQAYINTMRWYYLNHFTRYLKALETLKMHTLDKGDILGQDDAARKANTMMPAKSATPSRDTFSLGRRVNLLKSSNQAAITSYLAEEDKSTHYLETPFRNFNLALIDNASAEYSFLTAFFSPYSFHQVSRKFTEIFSPTFALGQTLTRTLIENSLDCLGILLCVRLNQKFAFELQRRKVPAMDSYINGTNIQLWPRFQVVMDMHCDSVRRTASAIPSGKGATSALSLTSADSLKPSAAPHPVTQRFAQLLQGIMLLSSDAGDDEPISNSLKRLRDAFDEFSTKYSRAFGDKAKGSRFLFNNYSLISTIISDAGGKLAEGYIEHYEDLKEAFAQEK
ncbi:MAG: hypothetical protein M1837_003830 [Sclerophora amabilis]|nr:MAG: hypothetical protein M1837_003830 [Sclerophora amabilis]